MRTNNINYTRLTNTRDVPPAGLGSTTPNIGFGLPNHTTYTLPLAVNSKEGDVVYNSTVHAPVYFDGTDWVAFYPPEPPPPAVPSIYGSIMQTAPVTTAYAVNTDIILDTGPIAAITAPVGITVGGATPARLTNSSTVPVTVSVSATIALETDEAITASLFLLKNGQQLYRISGQSDYTFVGGESRAYFLNTIVELNNQDFLEVYIHITDGVLTENVTTSQFNLSVAALPLSYGGLWSGGRGWVMEDMQANTPVLLKTRTYALPSEGILASSDLNNPWLLNNTGRAITAILFAELTLTSILDDGEIQVFFVKNNAPPPAASIVDYSAQKIRIIHAYDNFSLTGAIQLEPEEYVNVYISSTKPIRQPVVESFNFTMIEV